MKIYTRHSLFLFLLISIFILFIPLSAYPVGPSRSTIVKVLQGKVVCFELPEELVSKIEIGETSIGIFLERVNEEIGKVDISRNVVRAYIPQEQRDQIGDKLQTGVYVFLFKNPRPFTEWDIIAVGTVIKAGYEYSTGEMKQAVLESAIIPSAPVPEVATIDKQEQSQGTGEGESTPPTPSQVPEIIPTEPTPPPTELKPEPTAAISASPTSGNAPLTVTFDGSGSSTPSGTTIVSYSWGFGDGGTGTGSTTSHTYTTEGTYTVTLTVANDQGKSGSTTVAISVGAGASPTYYWVDPVNGNDSNNGSNSSPWRTITYALANANSSVSTTINLVAGTYGTSAAGYNGETFPLNMLNGFTLDGAGAGSSIIDGSGGTQGIIACSVITATIQDLTIQNGSNSSAANGGGGINCSSSTLTLNSCTVSNNTATAGRGGGIWSGDSTLNISGCTFSGNSSSLSTGGGIDWGGSAGIGTLTISGISTFSNNTATRGGGVALRNNGMSATITNTTFNTNTANEIPGGFYGGSIYMDTSLGHATITNCTIKNSTGCGIYNGGVAHVNINISNCIFYQNNKIPPIVPPEHDHLYSQVTSTYYDCDGPPPAAYKNMNGTDGLAGTGNQEVADPLITGHVYDSVTGEDIDSPVIAIYNATTNAQVGITTDNPFTFNVDSGTYYFAVSKSGYAFPSQIVAITTSGDHGDIFTAGSDPLTINIPMDSDGWLVVEKTCNKERVEIGDIVTYRLKIQNKHWYKSVENVELVDELVNGFKYVSNPSFNLGTVSANSTQTITYQVRVGSAVPPGRYKTAAYTRKTTTGTRNSNIDTTEIEVVENPLFTRGTIIGKVFWDENGNGVQDNGESGIARAVIATEYGVVVETDEVGKYHIADVPAGNHLLKVDNRSFPAYAKFTTDNPYYVKITEGLLAKVNFGLTPLTPPSPQRGEGEEAVPSPHRGEGKGEGANQFFIVALGEGIVRSLDTSGNIDMASSGRDDRYDDGVNVDGRLALYLKGKILGKYLIKASIDTDRDQRRLFTNLDPDKYYPVYGDASKVDYSGVDTQDIVWVLIEWDESLAKWGSFHTELPLYNRTLSGGIINYNSIGKTKFGDTRTKIKGFGAFSRQKPAHDEYVGTGGSLYYLRHRDIIEGSEKLKVEVRDRLGKITVNSIPLVEEKDYEIDYDTGRILLKRPLNSIQQAYNNSIISNDILMGERVYLVVDYEYYSGGLSDQSYGINGSQWLGNHIRVGGTYVEEQKTGDPYKLMGGDGTVKINKDTEVNVNYSRTEETQLGSTMSYDGGLTFTEQGESYSLDKSGSAVSVDGRTKLFNNTDIFLSYSRQDPFYSVTNSISSQGTQKYLGNIITKITENLSIGLSHLTQKYFEGSIAGTTFGATDSHTTTGILDWRPGKWDLRGEYQHQEVKNPITSYTYFGTLPLLDNDFIAVRIGYQLFSWLHPYIRGQVTVNGKANDQGTVGTDINIGRDTTINLAETVGTLGDSTLVGLTTKITEESDVYANLEVGNHTRLGKYTKTTYGQSTQLSPDSRAYIEEDYSSYRENVVRGNVLGYNKKVSGTFSLGLTYERSNVKNNTTAIDRDVGAISLSYLNPDWLKAYSKLEVRNDIGTSEIRQWVTQNDILWRTAEWLELSGRCNWGWTENQDTEFYEVGAGFSLRPVTWDKLNILGKYSYLTDYPPDSQWDFPLDIESIKNVYSIEGIYDLFKYLSLIGKFSYRDMTEKVGSYDWVDSDTYLYIARTNFHITHAWDISIEYRGLANDQIEDKKTGWLVEVDRDIGRYIRCGVGYNFTDYDDDLRNDDDWDAKGWFFKLAGKY